MARATYFDISKGVVKRRGQRSKLLKIVFVCTSVARKITFMPQNVLSKVKIGEDYVCPHSHLAMVGYSINNLLLMLKLIKWSVVQKNHIYTLNVVVIFRVQNSKLVKIIFVYTLILP